jgi:integrase
MKRKPGRGGKLEFDPILPKISQYWCRHTTATLMSKMGYSIDLIASSLGHDNGNKTTNIYIEYNQDAVDEANRKLIDYVNDESRT